MSVVAGLLVAAVSVPLTGLAGVVTRDAANTFNDLSVPQLGQVPVRSELLDTHGQVIAYYYPANIYRIPVKYAQISPDMRNAIVAIEDDRFYQHGALDPRGTFRAFVNDVNNESVQGGSTLAQQYVKNALILTSQSTEAKEDAAADTPERKIRELRIAANVVHELSPQQLLAAYLNVAYFENNAYGIQVAAARYFQTDASHLDLAQSALLAGLVENPSKDDPLTEPANALSPAQHRAGPDGRPGLHQPGHGHQDHGRGPGPDPLDRDAGHRLLQPARPPARPTSVTTCSPCCSATPSTRRCTRR